MPLTALDIYKVLPKTNCGECGVPTCLAFAMQLATKKAAIDACPYATDDAKATLAGAAAPPIRLVSIGPASQCIVMGKETVLFRHEETFYHPTAIAVRVRIDRGPEELRAAFERVLAHGLDRVGQIRAASSWWPSRTRTATPGASPRLPRGRDRAGPRAHAHERLAGRAGGGAARIRGQPAAPLRGDGRQLGGDGRGGEGDRLPAGRSGAPTWTSWPTSPGGSPAWASTDLVIDSGARGLARRRSRT